MVNHRQSHKKDINAAPAGPQKHLQTRPFEDSHTVSESITDNSTVACHGFNFANLPPIQPQLTIDQPNNIFEQEADQVANEVVQKIHSSRFAAGDAVQPKPLNINPVRYSPLQRNGGVMSGPTSGEFESQLNQARSGGSALEPQVKGQMESAMGADFSQVKVHTDAQADQLSQSVQAKAFTTGTDVFFKQGEYNPSSRSDQELLAHELTHVVQQTGAVSRFIQLKPQQPVGELDALMTQAKETNPKLEKAGKELADATHGKLAMGPLKDQARVQEKAASYPNGVRDVLDIVRCTIQYRNLYWLINGMEYIERSKYFVDGETRVKDLYFMGNDLGYRDIKFNLKMDNNHITEVQLNTAGMLEAKDLGHTLYDLVRSETPVANLYAKDEALEAEGKAANKVNKTKERLQTIITKVNVVDGEHIRAALGCVNSRTEPDAALKNNLKRISKLIYGNSWKDLMAEVKGISVQDADGNRRAWLDEDAGKLGVLPQKRDEIMALHKQGKTLAEISIALNAQVKDDAEGQAAVEQKIQDIISWTEEQEMMGAR